MRPSARLLASLALALTAGLQLAACDDAAGPAAPSGADELDALLGAAATDAAEPRQRGLGRKPLFDRLAEEIPSFGGLYRTGRCSVTVVLTDMADEQHAIRVVEAALESVAERVCPDGFTVRAQDGQFTYLELKGWLRAAHELLRMRGVHGVRIDYSLNRLVVVVASRDVAEAVREALPGLGIPEEAVVFKGRPDRPPRSR